MARVAQVRTQADLAMALGDLRLLTMSFAVYWVADLAVGCLFPLRWLLRLVGFAGTWRACDGLGHLTPGFAAAAHTTLVLLALRCIDFVLPVVPPFVFVGVVITWQWLLLGALRDVLRQARPGLAAQAHILRWVYAVIAVLQWIDIGGAVGALLALLLLAVKWLWVVGTFVTLTQVERVAAVLLRGGEPGPAAAPHGAR
jgi:hypothetical protein